MGLSLNAEQKYIIDIFSGKNQYIIPPYQRAYSWTEEQCSELYEDLKNAYLINKDEGYFLGNIVVAKSREEKNRLEVIDGQQRLITLTLLIKVLHELDLENNDLEDAIWIRDSRDKKIKEQRLKTYVFEEKDAKFLDEVISRPLAEICTKNLTKIENNFKKNICFFYIELNEFSENNNIQDFSDFLIDSVSLLPIETEDTNHINAREKALKIFETINNRGMSLSDSDIFKASLYSMALNELKQDDFINSWKELDERSNLTKYTIDEIFKVYTHIIRGKNGIKSPEIKLRDFFSNSYSFSPFKTKKYDEIMKDLFNILDSIEFYKNVIVNTSKYPELSKWVQLINAYTNQYPLMALLVYLYKGNNNRNFNENMLIDFCKNLVRFAYYQGSTTKIKTSIYSKIIDIMHNQQIQYKVEYLYDNDLKYFGRLKNSFALLAFYLNDNQNGIYPYYFDKIINAKDINDLNESWQDKDYYDYVDSIGNLLVIDIPKKNIYLKNKVLYYANSNVHSIQTLMKDLEDWTYQKFENRKQKLTNSLRRFFTDEN